MRKILKNKGAQGVFEMPFSMLFSILLIVFFIATAFIAIRYFLNFQKSSEIGMFYTELQDNIDKAWNSQSSSFPFNSTLPIGIEYACFVNLSAGEIGADPIEKEILDYVQFSGSSNKVNFVLWPMDKARNLGYKTINHVQLPDSNPYCIPVEDRKITIKIEKTFDETLPKVS